MSAQYTKFKSDTLLETLGSHMKNLEKENQIHSLELKDIEWDKKKILKLFNYRKWSQFMQWVHEKLQQSGQDILFEEKDQKKREDQLKKESNNIEGEKKIETLPKKEVQPVPQQNKPKSNNAMADQQELRQEGVQGIKDVLSEIVQEPDQESLRQTNENPTLNSKPIDAQESELLAIQNAKLRKANISLTSKVIQLKGLLQLQSAKNQR